MPSAINSQRRSRRILYKVLPAVKRVDVLRYHTLGEGKYYSLGMEYPIAPGTVCSDEFIDKVSEIANMVGVPINIEN